MSSKTKIPVEITGKLLVPVDLAILETLRTEMMGEALHDQIVEEALRVGVSTCLAGYNQVRIKRELLPLPKPKTHNSNNQKQKKSSSESKKTTQQLLEEEAEKMKPNGNTSEKKKNNDDDDDFPATKHIRDSSEQQSDHNASRFDGQRFIANVNFSGLQASIERLLTAFDAMAAKVDESINGPLAELEKLRASLPAEAVKALDDLKTSLSNAIAPPEVPTEVPKTEEEILDDENDDIPVSRYGYHQDKSSQKKNGSTNRISGTVVSVEDEDGESDNDGPTVEGKSLLAGTDSDEEDEEWKAKNPAEMGYQPLGDE